MNQYKQEFEERKERLLTVLRNIKAFYSEENNERDESIVGGIIKSVENGEFSIVVVGEFSAGKSTFLNAMMGERLLPSYTSETTATINFLRHYELNNGQTGGCVYYNDGHKEYIDKIDLDTIMRYVSTKSDMAVASDVDHLDLFLNSKFLEGNVTLIDSPGLNGIADKHSEITQQQIEKSSAGIFMFRADQPGSKSDFTFLRELKHKVHTVLLVLNRIDDIKQDEGETVESVIETIKKSYKKQFPDETTMPEIIGVSAYQALVARSSTPMTYHGEPIVSAEERACMEKSSNLKAFEDRLWKFLTQGEKGKQLLTNPASSVCTKLEDYNKKLQEEADILSSKKDSSDIQEKIIELEKQKEGIEATITKQSGDIKQEVRKLRSELNNLLTVEMENFRRSNISRLDNWQTIEDIENAEQTLEKNIAREVCRISEKMSDELQQSVNNIIFDKYMDIADEVNISYDGMNISLDKHYDITEADVQLGIEAYDKRIKAKQAEIEAKEAEMEQAELSVIRKRAAERRVNELREDRRRLEAEQRSYAAMPRPGVVHYTTIEQKEVEPSGIFGYIRRGLFGKKYQDVQIDRVDDSGLRQFKAEEASRQERFAKAFSSIDSEVREYSKEGSSEEALLHSGRVQKSLARLERELQQEREEFREKVEREKRNLIIGKRQKISDYVDDAADDLSKEFRHKFSEMESQIVGNIQQSITVVANKQLKLKLDELEVLKQQLDSSETEKNARMGIIADKQGKLGEFIRELAEIMSDIEALDTDEIEEEAL